MELKIAVICERGLGIGAEEQAMGARLALTAAGSSAKAVNAQWRDVAGEPLDRIVLEIAEEGYQAIVGIFSVPRSVEAAQACEDASLLYVTANNNPRVYAGRRHVFHIGVPSKLTAEASLRFLTRAHQTTRVAVLHTSSEFQANTARLMAEAATLEGTAVLVREVGASGPWNVTLVDEILTWSADSICLWGSEFDAMESFLQAAHRHATTIPMLVSRAALSSLFLERCADFLEGRYFVDTFVRSAEAAATERDLATRLAAVDSAALMSANHGFGWDCVHLALEALKGGDGGSDGAVEWLEGLRGWQGAGGMLTFSPTDHNGREHSGPTTFGLMSGGVYTVIDAGERAN